MQLIQLCIDTVGIKLNFEALNFGWSLWMTKKYGKSAALSCTPFSLLNLNTGYNSTTLITECSMLLGDRIYTHK